VISTVEPVEKSAAGRLAGRSSALRHGLLPLLLAAEIVFFSLASPTFLTTNNLSNVVINSSDLAVIAAGLTLVVLLGGIDVSTGSMLGVIAWVVATLNQHGTAPVLVIGAAVLAGAVLGSLNGGLIALGGVSPIIATLGTSAVFSTLLFLLWNSTDVFAAPVSPLLGSGRMGGCPLVGMVVLAVFALLSYLSRQRAYGWHVYAIGNDREGARLLGVKTTRVVFVTYLLLGGCVGLSAVIYAGRVGVVQASSGSELTLSAVAAVVVGGTSILGGEGSVLKTLGGLLFVAVLQNGVVLIGVPPLWNGVLVGVAVALAVWLDIATRRGKGRRR